MGETSWSTSSVATARQKSADLAIVLAVSWLARVAFATAIGGAHSDDVELWRRVLEAQHAGQNPYETGLLNWPPFWLQIIVLLDTVASHVGVSFWTVLRTYLFLAECALVVTLYLTLASVGASRDAIRRALLVGIALNPVAILLICQHGNSDVNVGLLVTLAVAALVAHWRSRDVVFWLGGCLLLGLGVLAKTVPLVLAPVLAPGARLTGDAGRALGAALLLGPAALGLSVLLALVPEATRENVIGYRSNAGSFGVQGLLNDVTTVDTWVSPVLTLALVGVVAFILRWHLPPPDDPSFPSRVFLVGTLLFLAVVLGLAAIFDQSSSVDLRSHYRTLFGLLTVGIAVWVVRRLWQEPPLTPQRLFLFVAVTFMFIVAFGPGYGTQYAYWLLPALVATYVLLDDAWRRLLLVGYVVAGVTYMLEYGFIPWLGAWVPAILGSSDWTNNIAEFLTPYRLVLLNLPLLMVYFLVLAEGVGRLVAPRTGERFRESALPRSELG
jgi:hypothetical protein